jgi:glycosyltransferase involved in cell wall biosynthesis
MKIVLAVHHFPPRYTGGAEWEAYRIASTLQERGHDVRVICVERIDVGTADGVTYADDIYSGVRVRRLSFNLAASPDPFRWEYDNLWIGDHLRAFLIEQRPDVFHLVGGYLISGRATRVAGELAIPTLVSLMDFWFLCRRITLLRSDGRLSALPISSPACARCLGEESRRYRWLGQLAPALADAFWRTQTASIRRFDARTAFLLESLNGASAIISRSNFLRSVFVEAGVNADRIHLSRQGRDFPNLSADMLVKTSSPALRIGYLGQIAAHKGVHVLLSAARHLGDAAFTVRVYGDPAPFASYAAELGQLIGNDDRLELAGLCRPEDLGQVLQNMDVLVVPSLWYENSPNVILEAFAHRTPVIASDLGGMSELVQAETNGLLFAPGDALGLARQLQRLLDEPDLLPQLRQGIPTIRSLAQEIDELENLYRSIVGQRIARQSELQSVATDS